MNSSKQNILLLWLMLILLPPLGIIYLFMGKRITGVARFFMAFLSALIFIAELAFFSPLTDPLKDTLGQAFDKAVTMQADSSRPSADSVSDSSELTVHFIDVGQADSILVQSPKGTAILIDGGNNDDGTKVVAYLKSQGITHLNAVIATHPHEDHIGGLDTVIKAFPPQAVYMPNATTTTRTFTDFINAVDDSGAKKIQAKSGVSLGVDGFSGIFLAPYSSQYDELNNYSAVLKLTYGSTSFLFTGDAENVSEKEMLKSGNLQATVLKVGHHGSDSSTTQSFLQAVTPQYAVISVGKDNSYGHPSQTVLKRLAEAHVQVFRTDQSGTVVLSSDGTKISVKQPAQALTSGQSDSSAGEVSILSIDLVGETVTLVNHSTSDVDLTGWKLVSTKGQETFAFPAGTVIPAQSSLEIVSGPKANPGENQIIWSKTNIWNNQGDQGILYDAQGTVE